jgi:hypothetical protein
MQRAFLYWSPAPSTEQRMAPPEDGVRVAGKKCRTKLHEYRVHLLSGIILHLSIWAALHLCL